MNISVALVVLLRGINVGGHRTFRLSALAEQPKHLDAVNIGAAGTFDGAACQTRSGADFGFVDMRRLTLPHLCLVVFRFSIKSPND